MLNDAEKQFLQYVGTDKARMEQIATMSPDELLGYTRENGFTITLENLRSTIDEFESIVEIGADELDQVSGGLPEERKIFFAANPAAQAMYKILYPPASRPSW
jgi:predicted ribosomally synthesized peptide with nif11-like leader